MRLPKNQRLFGKSRLPVAAIAVVPFLAVALSMATVPPPSAGVSGRVSFQKGFAQVVARCLPAVVRVTASKVVEPPEPGAVGVVPSGAVQTAPGPSEQQEKDLGSGVIVSTDGYILTNAHVIQGARRAHVVLGDRREFPARIVGEDAATDIAVLKIDATGLKAMPLGDSSKMKPGDFVIAIGSPYGLSKSVSMGIVSAVGRGDLGIEDYENFIQTDASVNPGNSGGALINVKGQLIGINTAIVLSRKGAQGIGLAIPVQLAGQVMHQMMSHGRVVRSWLGVRSQPVTPGLAKAFGLAGNPRGALVTDVLPGGPGARAGIGRGDIILALNGRALPTNNDLKLRIAATPPGTTIRAQVLRNRSVQELPVRLSEEPSPEHTEPPPLPSTSDRLLNGVALLDLNGNIAQHLHVGAATQGAVVAAIQPGSAAADSGLRPGDVIEEVNHRPVPDCASFKTEVGAAGDRPILLLVNRGGAAHFLVIEPD